MLIGERVNEIRLILQRPYHLFTYLPKEKQVMLTFESEDIDETPRLIFIGRSMIRAVESAEAYVKREQETGDLRKLEKDEEDEEKELKAEKDKKEKTEDEE